MTTFINLFGGPGAGKSTTAAGMFYKMKQRGLNVELVTEVAKDLVWEGRTDTLSIQPYVTVKQYRNLVRLKGKVDFVITDAPVVQGVLYANKFGDLPESYAKFIVDCHHIMLTPSINIMLERQFKYDPTGRYQSEHEAMELDAELRQVLDTSSVEYNILHPLDAMAFVDAVLAGKSMVIR